jgi:hypothetical protein
MAVLLAYPVCLHAHQRLQQDGFPGFVLPCVSDEALSASMPGTGGDISRLDRLVRLRLHLPMYANTSCIQ